MKAQWIRLADVFLIGPMMVYFGVKAEKVPATLRLAMIAAGAGTVIYNGRNYLIIRKQDPPVPPEGIHQGPTDVIPPA